MLKEDQIEGLKLFNYRCKINSAYIAGQTLQKEMVSKKLKIAPQASIVFTKTFDAVTEMYKEYQRFQREDKGRHRPVVVFLYGAPNAGKSNLMNWIINDLMYIFDANGNVLPKYDYREANEYHDGYFSQFATVMDDFLQTNDLSERRAEVRALMSMANDATLLLHMAKLEEKGSTFFDSPLILCSANKNDVENLGIEDKIAYARRRDFLVEVKVNPLFGELVKVSGGSLYKLKAGLKFDRKIWLLTLRDPITGVAIDSCKDLTHDDLIVKIATLMKERQNDTCKLTDYLKTQPPLQELKDIKKTNISRSYPTYEK